ncbi:hypothetical protein Cgig2_032694 [Carnegiea gigantea]|uniref:Uncharacterized protein n=1 Tax=Carnegiea gigantea TaxID=171969 RepID=A0A9Q1KHX5_9CARY|nr:hypothetical protein Cgig2_032694 [Carnegiea gigantea]
MRLTLLIDSTANKVVLAEADKDFVDFLFDVLSLSVGTVMQLLEKKDMAGCLGDLYRGAEALNQGYLLPQVTKDLLLKQRSPVDVPLLSLKPMSLSLMEPHVKEISSLTEKDVEVGLNELPVIFKGIGNIGSISQNSIRAYYCFPGQEDGVLIFSHPPCFTGGKFSCTLRAL